MLPWDSCKPCWSNSLLQRRKGKLKTLSEIMYPRGFNYNRPPYPVPAHESHCPPPLSHPPYVYNAPSRYTCSSYPSTGAYPVQNTSPSYGRMPQPLTHYEDPRYMEIGPRDEAVIPLHHLPQRPQHASAIDFSEQPRQSMEGASHLLPSCEQGNETILLLVFTKINPSLSVMTSIEALNTLFGMHLK